MRGICRSSAGRPEDKISLGRPKHMWEDIIKMTVKYWIGFICLGRGAKWKGLVNTVMNLKVPLTAICKPIV
jgi:hypothetical protein